MCVYVMSMHVSICCFTLTLLKPIRLKNAFWGWNVTETFIAQIDVYLGGRQNPFNFLCRVKWNQCSLLSRWCSRNVLLHWLIIKFMEYLNILQLNTHHSHGMDTVVWWIATFQSFGCLIMISKKWGTCRFWSGAFYCHSAKYLVKD